MIVSWHDLKYGAKLAPKKYVLLKADDDQLISKGSVRRVKNIISDSCKAIQKDQKKLTGLRPNVPLRPVIGNEKVS